MIIARTKFKVKDLKDIPFSKGKAKLEKGVLWFFYNDTDGYWITINMDTGETALGKSSP